MHGVSILILKKKNRRLGLSNTAVIVPLLGLGQEYGQTQEGATYHDAQKGDGIICRIFASGKLRTLDDVD